MKGLRIELEGLGIEAGGHACCEKKDEGAASIAAAAVVAGCVDVTTYGEGEVVDALDASFAVVVVRSTVDVAACVGSIRLVEEEQLQRGW